MYSTSLCSKFFILPPFLSIKSLFSMFASLIIGLLSNKTPSKINGVAIGDANLADYEPSNSSRIFINIFPIQFRPLPIPNPHL